MYLTLNLPNDHPTDFLGDLGKVCEARRMEQNGMNIRLRHGIDDGNKCITNSFSFSVFE